jgi:hypothetical protein
MRQVQIKHRWNGSVLFAADIPDNTPSGLETRVALEKATEAGANLTGANLTGANFADAYLAGAYLADAYLAGANLTGADLTGANLTGANLTGANLTGANLTGTKWRNGIVIAKQPLQVYGLRWVVTILDAHMQIGCELHSLADWQTFNDARICAMDGRDALRFWRDHKDALLSLALSAGRSFEPVTADEVTA